MSEKLEKELKETKQRVKDLVVALKQILTLVTVSGRADIQTVLDDIKFIAETELKNK